MSESIHHHHDIAAEQDRDPDDAARELGARACSFICPCCQTELAIRQDGLQEKQTHRRPAKDSIDIMTVAASTSAPLSTTERRIDPLERPRSAEEIRAFRELFAEFRRTEPRRKERFAYGFIQRGTAAPEMPRYVSPSDRKD